MKQKSETIANFLKGKNCDGHKDAPHIKFTVISDCVPRGTDNYFTTWRIGDLIISRSEQ